LNSSRKGFENGNLPSTVTFLFFLDLSNHHQDLMDNFYWMMKIVLIECLSQHHIANVIDLKKSINIQEFHISNKIV